MDSAHHNILPYNPEWVTRYEQEIESLKPIFGDSLVDVAHIGSTSVPGLPSKPIIDIAVLIDSHVNADSSIEPLEALGYRFDRELHANTKPAPERHFLRKGFPTEFHLSIGYADKANFFPRQIAFRDWLREHPEDRDAYAILKETLITKDPTGSDEYIGGKTDFINGILIKSGFKK